MIKRGEALLDYMLSLADCSIKHIQFCKRQHLHIWTILYRGDSIKASCPHFASFSSFPIIVTMLLAIVSRKEVDLTQDNDPAQDSDASVIYVRIRRMRPAGISNLVAKLCSVNPIKIQVAVTEVPDRRGRTYDVKVYAYLVEVGQKVVLYYRYGMLLPNCRDII